MKTHINAILMILIFSFMIITLFIYYVGNNQSIDDEKFQKEVRSKK